MTPCWGAQTATDDFDAFFRAHYVAVVHCARDLLGDPARAEETAQDAFTALYVRWERISMYDNPLAWVRRVTAQMAIRRARRDQRREALERHVHFTSRSEAADLDLRAAVARLPREQHDVVVLHHLQDRPVREVAETLGIPVATAKTRLHRARRRLACWLIAEDEANAT